MLKDITLGQFFPADTPVHRLDPRTKLLCVILYIVALFSAKSVLTYGIMIAVLTVSVLVSKVPFKSLTKGLKPVYFVVAFTAIMNMFFTAGTPVADVWLLRSITWEGIIAAVQMVLRIILLIMGMGTTVTGLIIRFTPTAVGGVAAIILAPFTLIAGDMWQPLLFIAGFVVMMIVPGHILNYKSNHPKQ